MNVIKTTAVAVLFACLAQIGAHPSQPQLDGPATAIVQAAENCFAKIRADVASGLQTRLKSREISSRDLVEIGALLNASAARLQEAGFEEKLNRAGQQVGMVQTQVLAVLKDPGNKEIFAVGLEPEKCLNQIKLERASGAVLDKKIERMRGIVEELRKCAVILEAVTPPEQLSERLKLRLTQLLGEWREGAGPDDPTDIVAAKPDRDEPLNTETQNWSASANGPRVHVSIRASEPVVDREENPRSQIISAPKELASTAAKVVRMTRQKMPEKAILKFIAASNEPFRIKSADQILKLREEGVSSPSIAAMLRRDEQLRGSAAYNR